MVNNKIKEVMRTEGYTNLGKRNYYDKNQIASKQAEVTSSSLCVTKGFKLTLVCMEKEKNFVLIDNCTRILQTQTFLDELMNAKTVNMQQREI